MLDDLSRDSSSRLSSALPQMLLVATAALSLVGLFITLLQDERLSLVAYLVVLVLGTASLAAYRWLEAQRSLHPDYVIAARWKRRAAFLPAVLLLLSCAGNAFVWATEVAKI